MYDMCVTEKDNQNNNDLHTVRLHAPMFMYICTFALIFQFLTIYLLILQSFVRCFIDKNKK